MKVALTVIMILQLDVQNALLIIYSSLLMNALKLVQIGPFIIPLH